MGWTAERPYLVYYRLVTTVFSYRSDAIKNQKGKSKRQPGAPDYGLETLSASFTPLCRKGGPVRQISLSQTAVFCVHGKGNLTQKTCCLGA
jgi:hypothetical protein